MRRSHIPGHIVELSGRDLPEEILPACAAVIRNHDASIVAVDNVVSIGRIDPKCMMIAMGAVTFFIGRPHDVECLPAIDRLRQGHAHDVHDLRIHRIDADLTEHPSIGAGESFQFIILRTDFLPVFSLILAAIDLNAEGDDLDGASVGIEFTGTRVALGCMVVYICIDPIRF